MHRALYELGPGLLRVAEASGSGPHRRLPDGAGEPPDLRLDDRAPARGGLGAARAARAVRRPGARRRHGRARRRDPGRAAPIRLGACWRRSATRPIDVAPAAPRGVHRPASGGRLRRLPRASGRPAGARRRAGQRAPRRPAGAPRRGRPPTATPGALRRSARRTRPPTREPVHDRPRAAVHARARGAARGGGHRAPARPARRDLPRARAWLDRAATPLERGLVLLIDYGAPADELYAPDRGSTLRAYHRHRVHADPFVAIGRQDLTAHVDLTAVERAAAAAGLSPLGRARQAEFLAALGIGDLLVGLQSNLGDDAGGVPRRAIRRGPHARPARDRRLRGPGVRPRPARGAAAHAASRRAA